MKDPVFEKVTGRVRLADPDCRPEEADAQVLRRLASSPLACDPGQCSPHTEWGTFESGAIRPTRTNPAGSGIQRMTIWSG